MVTLEARHRYEGQILRALYIRLSTRFYSVSDEGLLKGFCVSLKAWSGAILDRSLTSCLTFVWSAVLLKLPVSDSTDSVSGIFITVMEIQQCFYQ